MSTFYNLILQKAKYKSGGDTPTPPQPPVEITPFYVEDASGSDNSLTLEKKYDDTPNVVLEYSTDKKVWNSWADPYTTPLPIGANSKVYLRGTNESFANGIGSNNKFNCSGNYNVGGDLTTLLTPNGGVLDISQKYCCFFGLFDKSETLINAKDLILTSETLGHMSYAMLFCDCKNMISAPKLLAKNLFLQCYGSMFSGCNKLSEIEIGATTWVENCSVGWLKDVAPNGNIIMPTELQIGWNENQINSGVDGIPNGWLVNGKAPIIPPNYFYVEDVSGKNNQLQFNINEKNLSYSIDDGGSWQEWTTPTTNPISFGANKRVYLRGTNIRLKGKLNCSENYNVGGDVTTILQPEGNVIDMNINENNLSSLFENSLTLISAKRLKLVSENVAFGAYNSMFKGCTNLIEAPKFYGKTIATSGCEKMFMGCEKLEYPMSAEVTEIGNYGFQDMYNGCTAMKTTPILTCLSLGISSYLRMFMNCKNIYSAKIMATEFKQNSCKEMFKGCSNLSKIEVNATYWEDGYSTNWVEGVNSGLTNKGYFRKPKELTSMTRGVNGIPANWEVVDK